MNFEEIMYKQPIINICTIGSVSNGKTTLMKALTGESTAKFHKEKERNMTIKLGYTSCKIWECPKCEVFKYHPTSSKKKKSKCPKCCEPAKLVNHISFVDCPGHHSYLGTMMSGVTVVDGCLLVTDGSKKQPAQQTIEHLKIATSLDIVKDNMLVFQNKLDLVSITDACLHLEKIRYLLWEYKIKSAPIVPISAQSEYNIDAVCEYLMRLKPHKRDITHDLLMQIIRTFDVNKPGCEYEKMTGGVIGGVIIRGMIKIGDEVVIQPGLIKKGGFYTPIKSKVLSIKCGTEKLETAYPGANVGLSLTIDPFISKQDRLVGSLVGHKMETMPDCFKECMAPYFPINKYDKLSRKEDLIVNIGSSRINAIVKAIVRENEIKKLHLILQRPVCASFYDKFLITQKIKNEWTVSYVAYVEKIKKLSPS